MSREWVRVGPDRWETAGDGDWLVKREAGTMTYTTYRRAADDRSRYDPVVEGVTSVEGAKEVADIAASGVPSTCHYTRNPDEESNAHVPGGRPKPWTPPRARGRRASRPKVTPAAKDWTTHGYASSGKAACVESGATDEPNLGEHDDCCTNWGEVDCVPCLFARIVTQTEDLVDARVDLARKQARVEELENVDDSAGQAAALAMSQLESIADHGDVQVVVGWVETEGAWNSALVDLSSRAIARGQGETPADAIADLYGSTQLAEAQMTLPELDAPVSVGTITREALRVKNIAVTGKVPGLTRDELDDALAGVGAILVTSVTSTTDALVVGDKPGKTKLDAATRHGTAIINADDLLEALGL